MIWVSESTVKLVAGVVPNFTAVAPARFLPVIFTLAPPAIEPAAGVSEVISASG